MQANIDQDSLEYGIELKKAIQYLASITGNGKGFVCKPKGATILYERAERDKPKFEKKQRKSRHESGDAFSAGGVKKYPKRANFFCEDEGHTATACPLKKEFLEKKKRSTGSANVVETSLETQNNDEEDCQYALYWATFRAIRDERIWLLESGASHHICGTGFASQNQYACNLSVNIADGRTIKSSTYGHFVMEINVSGKQTKILLQDVHVIPGLRKNLVSICQLAKKGIHTFFTDQGASLWKLDDTGVKLIVGGATWDNELC